MNSLGPLVCFLVGAAYTLHNFIVFNAFTVFTVGALLYAFGWWIVLIFGTPKIKINTLNSESRVLISLIAIVYVGALLLHYPGFMSHDDPMGFIKMSQGLPWDWFGTAHSLSLLASHFMLGGLGFMVVSQVLALMVTIIFLFKLIDESQIKASWIKFLACIIVLLPRTQAILLSSNRDTIMAIGLMTWAVLFFYTAIKREKRFSTKMTWTFSLSLAFLAAYRMDGFIILFVLLALPWVLKHWGRKEQFISLVSTLLIYFLIYLLPSLSSENFQTRKNYRYQITAFINPLNEIIYRHKHTFSEEEKEIVDKVCSFRGLSESVNLLYISPEIYQMKNPSAEEWGAFKWLVLKVFMRFPLDFFRNRARMIWTMLTDLDPATPDYLSRAEFSASHVAASKIIPLKLKQNGALATWHSRIIRERPKGMWVVPHLATVLWIPLLILLGIFYFRRMAPISALLSVMALSRFPVFFVFSPAAYYKYLLVPWFAGFTFWVLFIVENKIRKSQTMHSE